MKNHVKIIIFSIFLLFLVILAGFGLSKVKVDDFHKAAVIFVVDSSASNIKDLPAQTRVLKQLCSMLDPEDHIKILRVSEKSYIIYEGSPQSSSEIRKSMDKFTKFDEKEYGTAYGLSLKKAFSHAQNLYNDGYVPAVVVMGDLENEGAIEHQIDWNTFPSDVLEMKKQTDGKFSMMFLYAAPEKLDYVKEKLTPVLGEDKLIIGTEATAHRVLSKFLAAIGR
jgi:hypothetical protein